MKSGEPATQKVKPVKKIPETDAIFENLAKANKQADQNGNHPQIHLIKQTYQKGIIVRDPELKTFRQFWQCSETLPKWDVTIAPPELVSYLYASPLKIKMKTKQSSCSKNLMMCTIYLINESSQQWLKLVD